MKPPDQSLGIFIVPMEITRVDQLDAIIAQVDLNNHPFYQDWRMGTLPVDKLRAYAADYGRFVDTIDEGWDRIGETNFAAEERTHEAMWARFQLDIAAGAATGRPQTETLVTAARNAFALEPEAVGALYSFEAQQPRTSRSSQPPNLCKNTESGKVDRTND